MYENREYYLVETEIIDYAHPDIQALARELVGVGRNMSELAKLSFEWVRDNIQHSMDIKHTEVTCSASEVLRAGHGICYAKSHLLAALFRANGIPSGFAYQRLRDDECGFCLHGFNTVYLPEFGWYRVDARGNKVDVDAQFDPPRERLAFTHDAEGEIDYAINFSEPWPTVVLALKMAKNVEELSKSLPGHIIMG